MQEKVYLSKKFLTTQRDHWVLFAVVLTILNEANIQMPNFILWGALSLVPFIFFLIRRYSNNILIFFAGHLGLVASVFLMPSYDKIEKVWICIMAIIYFAQSLDLRFHKSSKEYNGIIPVISVAIIAISLLFRHYLDKGNNQFEHYYIILFLVFFCLYAIQYYIDNFLVFLNVNKSSVGYIPKKEIFITGIIMSAIYTGCGVLVLLFASNIKWLEQILKLVRYGIISVLKFLLGFSKPYEHTFEPEEEMLQDIPYTLISPEKATSFWLWEVIKNILTFAIIIIIIVTLFSIIKQGIKYLIRRFREKGLIIENTNETVRDVRQKCEVEKRAKNITPFWRLSSPNEKIKKYYKKRILKEKEKIIGDLDVHKLNYYTPMECGICIEDTEMIHLYEKARYSNDECNKDDFRNMKKSGTDIRKSSSSYNV